jgi:hypothetical protein
VTWLAPSSRVESVERRLVRSVLAAILPFVACFVAQCPSVTTAGAETAHAFDALVRNARARSVVGVAEFDHFLDLGGPTASAGLERNPEHAGVATNSVDDASSIVRYDPQWASRQLAGQNLPSSTGYATTPGGRTFSAHAAERTFVGGPGRAPVDPGLVDDILNQGTRVGFDPIRDTIKVSAPNLCGRCYVVVDAQTGQHVVTVMVPK